jgi:hypothetical protein
MLTRTVVSAFLLLAPMKIVLAQPSGAAPSQQGNQACASPKPLGTPPALSGAKPAPDDTKLPGGNTSCTSTGAPSQTTKTDPGSGVMVTSPTGMMTNPGMQPMQDAPKTGEPK